MIKNHANTRQIEKEKAKILKNKKDDFIAEKPQKRIEKIPSKESEEIEKEATEEKELQEEGPNQKEESATKKGKQSSFSPDYSRIHTFYYMWYRNKEKDGYWDHWNHKVLPHWEQSVNARHPNIGVPYIVEKDEIATNFWPQLGPYSSVDENVIRTHFKQMVEAGIGVAVLSWWGRKAARDENSKSLINAEFVWKIFKIAEEFPSLFLAFHIEPYEARTAVSVALDIKFLVETFGNHPNFYKFTFKKGDFNNFNSNDKEILSLPVIYVYDSYLINPVQWKNVLQTGISNNEKNSMKLDEPKKFNIRNTKWDALVIGLILNPSADKFTLKDGCFDGFYTYFASDGFTGGSRSQNWKELSDFAKTQKMMFIPSVGPGYIDTRVRPWNDINTKQRESGKYYERMFQNAINSNPEIISITSWNEWHEGTQIEPAISTGKKTNSDKNFVYESYPNHDPYYYLKKTLEHVEKFLKNKKK